MITVHNGVWCQLSIAIYLYLATDPNKMSIEGLFTFSFNNKTYKPLYKTSDNGYVFLNIDPGSYQLLVQSADYHMTEQPVPVTIEQNPSDKAVLFVPMALSETKTNRFSHA